MCARFLALAAAMTLSAWASDPADVTSGGKVVRIPVHVADEQPLRAADLKATMLGGATPKVLRVLNGQHDMMLLVVADLVGDLALITPARHSLLEEAARLPSSVWIGLLRAQDGLRVVSDPGPDREKLAAAMQTLPIAGKAGLLDTVAMAAKLADSIAARSNVRLAVLYLTDSDVRNYREDFTNPVINSSDSRDLSRRFPEGLVRERIARLTETLAAHQTPVFIVHLMYSRDRLNEAYQGGLMKLAAATGGSALFCRSRADVGETVAKAVRSVQKLHVVHVQLPQRAPKNVTLTLDAGGRGLDYRSRFLLP